MGVTNYVATLKFTPVTDGNRTFAEWSAEFDAPPAQERKLANRVFYPTSAGRLLHLEQRTSNLTNRSAE